MYEYAAYQGGLARVSLPKKPKKSQQSKQQKQPKKPKIFSPKNQEAKNPLPKKKQVSKGLGFRGPRTPEAQTPEPRSPEPRT